MTEKTRLRKEIQFNTNHFLLLALSLQIVSAEFVDAGRDFVYQNELTNFAEKLFARRFLNMSIIILIAESKTMTACRDTVPESEYLHHRPLLLTETDSIMNYLRSLSAGSLSEAIGISHRMAASMYRMIQDFPDKTTGAPAISAYTGVVFKALDYASLTPKAKRRCSDSVRIISSLYGWLSPDDIIKPYRLEYGSRVAPDNMPLNRYWRPAVTDCLTYYIKAHNPCMIIDLLPLDAAKSIEMTKIRKIIPVYKVDFMEIQPGDILKRPNSSLLKMLRGELLRRILSDDIDSIESLSSIESNSFYFESIAGDGTITFITA